MLEAIWSRLPRGSSERELLQAVIQLAAAELKAQASATASAERLLRKARSHVEKASGLYSGLDPHEVERHLARRLASLAEPPPPLLLATACAGAPASGNA